MRRALRNPIEPIDPGTSLFVSAASLRRRLDWFNKLRWGAALGVLVATLISAVVLHAVIEVRGLMLTGVVLLLLNAVYVLRSWRTRATDVAAELRLLKVQMVFDLLLLTALLHFAGSVENPLMFLYIVHVIIASLLFKGREIVLIAWLAIFLFTAEVFAEYFGLLPHHHLPTAGEVAHDLPFIMMTLGSLWLVILFSAWIGARIMKHNRTIKNELVARQAQLLDEDRAKTDFFRFVTHEIKSPVNTAQSGVETALELNGDAMTPSTRDLLGRSIRRLGQATAIIQDLADLTRGGVLKVENLAVLDFNDLVTKVVDSQKEASDRAGLKVNLVLPDPPVTLTTIRSMIETIVTNLVNNAIRYNRHGGRISVRLVDTGKLVRLVVEDEGIGIPDGEHDLVFDEFYRTQEAREISNLGTGLGLAIVKKFVKELGGFVELDSEAGKGSIFTLVLPRESGKRGRLIRSEEDGEP